MHPDDDTLITEPHTLLAFRLLFGWQRDSVSSGCWILVRGRRACPTALIVLA